MAMQPVYLKEHEGIGQYSSVNSAPWWSNAFGSQSVYGGESCGQMKPFSLELSNYIDQLAPTKHLARGVEQLFDKVHHTTNQFTIFP
ncbi:nuclear transcription factor Y subunit A-10-like, partial [Trifolium medium]|nr:nuclear transcription factor Y subunit A-10-like [Trifolium medium]